MTTTASPDLLASDVAWDLEPLLEGRGPGMGHGREDPSGHAGPSVSMRGRGRGAPGVMFAATTRPRAGRPGTLGVSAGMSRWPPRWPPRWPARVSTPAPVMTPGAAVPAAAGGSAGRAAVATTARFEGACHRVRSFTDVPARLPAPGSPRGERKVAGRRPLSPAA